MCGYEERTVANLRPEALLRQACAAVWREPGVNDERSIAFCAPGSVQYRLTLRTLQCVMGVGETPRCKPHAGLVLCRARGAYAHQARGAHMRVMGVGWVSG
jgi:hypothetical protein